MHKSERTIRRAIERECQGYLLAGLRVQWGGTHRAGEVVLMLGDTRESVYFPKISGRDAIPGVVGRVRRALRAIGATQIDMYAIRQSQPATTPSRPERWRKADEALFKRSS